MFHLVITLAALVQSQPAVVAQAKAALEHVIAGEAAKVEEQFTDEMKAALPPGRLAAAWSRVLFQAGAFKGCDTSERVVSIADKQMVIRTCTFERGKVDVQFAFNTQGKISGLNFRPSAAAESAYALPPYAKPSAYAERSITIGSGEWTLPGVLTLPVGDAPVPAVILVHGSGPNDRDTTIGANKPFRDLALGLASRGVAVLRYDKRTKVHPGKLAGLQGFTVRQEVIDDVSEAVRVLQTHPRVERGRIFVLGHSLGGMLVPRIAAADRNVAGFIVMAGAARALDEAMEAQARYVVNADGTITPDEQAALDKILALVASVRALRPSDAGDNRNVGGAPASYWLDLRGYDPPTAAKAITAPILILQGARDYQVTVTEFERWKAALGTRSNVTFRLYTGLNNLFIAGTGPSLPDEYQVPGHVAEEVIRDVAAWILGGGRL